MDLIDIAIKAYWSEYRQWGYYFVADFPYIHRNEVSVKKFLANQSIFEVEAEYKALAHKAAFKMGMIALTLTNFPDTIHEKVKDELPWVKLLDSSDEVEGSPPEAIAKSYIAAIASLSPLIEKD